MARLTLARKIATIVLIVWKKGVTLRRQIFEATNSLSVSDRVRSIPGDLLWRWPIGFSRHSGSRASLSWLVRQLRASGTQSHSRP